MKQKKELKKGPPTILGPPLEYVGFDEEIEKSKGDDSGEWSTAWADLMMTMFVMFAMMFIYMKSERNLTEAFQPGGGTEPQGGSQTLTESASFFPEHRKLESSGQPTKVTPSADPSRNAGLSPTSRHPLKASPSPETVGGLPPEEILKLAEEAVNTTDLENVQVLLEDDQTVKISLRGPLLFDSGSADLRDQTRLFLDKVAGILQQIENEVHVVGHTDTFPIYTPNFPTNWELSAARAASVARYLIRVGDLTPGRFTIIGHSMYKPALPNTTVENKQLNRRVEILITKKIYKYSLMDQYGIS